MSEGPIDLRVDIAPGAEPDGDPADWQWLDIGGRRRQTSHAELSIGRDDESSDVEAATATAVVDDRDGYLSPRNPYGDLYGLIGQNTPVRYRLGIFADSFDRTVGSGWGTATSGQAWTAGSAYSVSSGEGHATLASANTASEAYVTAAGAADVDFLYSASLSAVTTGGPWISGAEVRRVDSDNLYRVHTEFKPSGEVYLKISRRMNGSNADIGNDAAMVDTYSAGSKVWTRIQAEGAVIRARAWSGTLDDEPTTWDVSTDEATEIEGVGLGFFQWRFSTNTNVGSLTASIDDIDVHALLWYGNIPEWPLRWDKSGADSTITLVGAGPLRRLNTGERQVLSPLRRQLPRYNPAGYWPLEDESGATVGASAVPGGRPAAVTGEVNFGNTDAPPGASASAQMTDTNGTILRGQITGNTTGEFAAMFLLKFETLPVSETTIMEWRCHSGSVKRWVIRASSTGFVLEAYDAEGNTLEDQGVLYDATDPTTWTAIQLETVQNGGTIEWVLIWHHVGEDVFWFMAGDFTGTSGRLTEFYVPGSTGVANALYGHVWAGTEELPFVDSTFLAVSNGYIGELAKDRIARLCAEHGVPIAIGPGDSEPMGRQRADEFLALLRECARTDLGILYERATGLGYVPRGGRYNQPIALQLDWAAGELAEAPEPTDDDQRLRNVWTVSRTGGSEYTYEDPASVARHGRIRDSLEVNIERDDRLPAYAQFITALTTIDELRWPVIEIDLLANPHLIPQVLGLRPGKRVVVINPKDQIAGVAIDQVVEGLQHSLGRHRWRVQLACSPASPWKVATWDGGSRWGAKTSVMDASAASGVTTLEFNFTSKADIWSSDANDYEWLISGETVTVREVFRARSVAQDSGQFVVNGIANWTATAGTLSLDSTVVKHPGARSALITVSGSPASVGLRVASAAAGIVEEGHSYTLHFWSRTSIDTSSINGVINWFDGASFISSSGGDLASAQAGAWTKYEMTFDAPAGANLATYGGTLGGSPANGTEFRLYGVDLVDNDLTGYPQRAIVTRAVNGVAKTLPAGAPVRLAEPARWAL